MSNCKNACGTCSDGYHTFDELYEFRRMYNAALFNEWALNNKYDVHKSKKHSDGQLCFGGGWFIVIAELPTGQISNHYELKYWNEFNIPIKDKANIYDGHTSNDVLTRLMTLNMNEKLMTFGEAIEALNEGKKVSRKGWNGKGMYLWLKPAFEVPVEKCVDPRMKEAAEADGGKILCLPTIAMFTHDSTGRKAVLTGWLASQSDMLSNDWVIVKN